jgi:hypothetical protein
VSSLKCHYHPRANAVTECSVCGVGLCRRCSIEDRGNVFCDGCYASGDAEDGKDFARDTEEIEHEDYIDMELMDLLDTDEDEGLM